AASCITTKLSGKGKLGGSCECKGRDSLTLSVCSALLGAALECMSCDRVHDNERIFGVLLKRYIWMLSRVPRAPVDLVLMIEFFQMNEWIPDQPQMIYLVQYCRMYQLV